MDINMTPRERELMEAYTEVRVFPGGKNLKKKVVLLRVEHQRFYLGFDPSEDEADIYWIRAMVGKALARLLEVENTPLICPGCGERAGLDHCACKRGNCVRCGLFGAASPWPVHTTPCGEE